jgi:ribosome-interacting GTPase 1
MPANLTPQYHKAEDAYRRAQSAEERLHCLEEMLRTIPKHKGTDKLQADLKHRLKEVRDEIAVEKKSPRGSAASRKIPRQGAGTIVVLGGPNAGKSRLVKELTGANVEVADYPFTTREPAPGMMRWNDVMVQLVDTPPIAAERFESYLSGMVRSADAAVVCFNGASDDAPDETAAVFKQLSARKTNLGVVTGFSEDDYSVVNVRTLLVATRGSDADAGTRIDFWNELSPAAVETAAVEFDDPASVEALRETIYRLLNVMRVYTKAPGKKPDATPPFSLPTGATVEDLALKVHQEVAAKLKFAKVWSGGAADPQTAGPLHVLKEGDLVELHTS